jgi:hypothetical protein
MAQINIKKNASSSVSTPPSGVQALFIGTDGVLYGKSDAGAVTQLAGLTGPSGSAGSSGTSGVNGNNGSSGTSGVNGNDGSAGSSGTSGVSGTSGTSPGGGGAAGLVAGVGLNSVQSNITLTPGATAIGPNSIAIGSTVSAYGTSVYIGTKLTDIGTSSVYIGNNINQAYGDEPTINTVAIGSNIINRTSEPGPEYIGGSVIIGHGAKVDGFYYGHGNISIGTSAANNDFNNESVAIGAYAVTGRLWSVAIGRSAIAGGQDSAVALGCNSNAGGATSFAAMRDSNASGTNAIAIGRNAIASGENSTALAPYSSATHENSVALGMTVSSVVDSHTHVRNLFISNPPVYADNTAALAGGLVAGQVYRTSTGVLMITY